MQAELKINRRADKNDLMVINRLEALHQLITMQNSKQREQTLQGLWEQQHIVVLISRQQRVSLNLIPRQVAY